MMVEFLHDRNVDVLEPLTHIFCALVNQGKAVSNEAGSMID